jgi:hypothetical protein
LLQVGLEAHDIPEAIIVNHPVRLIVANFYGQQREGMAEDDNVAVSADALVGTYEPQRAQGHRITLVRVATPDGVGQNRRREGQIPSWSTLQEYLTQRAGELVAPGTVVSIDTLGHGVTSAEFPHFNAMQVVISAGNVNRTTTIAPPPVPGGCHPAITEPVFARLFETLLARNQPVDITLYHCHCGHRAPMEPNAVQRLANALNALQIRNVTVHSWPGIVEFRGDWSVDEHGNRHLDAAYPPRPLGEQQRFSCSSANQAP